MMHDDVCDVCVSCDVVYKHVGIGALNAVDFDNDIIFCNLPSNSAFYMHRLSGYVMMYDVCNVMCCDVMKVM